MSNWPIYYKDLIRVSNPDSPVGIITLWTICEQIIEKINPKLFCSAGQLYTKNGINYLIRNLLANKKIRYLIVCGQDRSGSGAELKKIWLKADGEKIHKEINNNSLKNLIKNVKLIDLIGTENPEIIIKKINSLDLSLISYGKNETFPETKEKDLSELECSWPSDNSIYKVKGETIAVTWLKALKNVIKFGDIKTTDAMKIKEICNLSAVITNEDPDNFYIPEWLAIDKKKIDKYLPQIIDGEKIPGLHYTYGERLQKHFKINQVEKIIERLKKDKNAREAIGVLFDPKVDFSAEHRPCIVLIQALRNHNALNFTAFVRSHDIFGGWPLNAFGLRKLQKIISDSTGIRMGSLTLISGSAHIYDFNWQTSLNMIKANLQPRFENDPYGFFRIETDKEKNAIIIMHYSPEGNFLKEYREIINSKNAVKNLVKKIDEDLAVSLVIHGLYLGIELTKAETCLKLGINYIQDKPLEIKQ